jgi:DNA-binding HxlR family transcriptional regulator
VLRALITGSHRCADIKATSPVRVEYELTEMGRDVTPVLDAVIAWPHRWIPLPADDEDDSTSHPEAS